jgi:hypothetical protein
MYIYTHIHTHSHTYIIYTHTCIHTYIHTYMHTPKNTQASLLDEGSLLVCGLDGDGVTLIGLDLENARDPDKLALLTEGAR